MEDKETYVCLTSKDCLYVVYSHIIKESGGFTEKWFSNSSGRFWIDFTPVNCDINEYLSKEINLRPTPISKEDYCRAMLMYVKQ